MLIKAIVTYVSILHIIPIIKKCNILIQSHGAVEREIKRHKI